MERWTDSVLREGAGGVPREVDGGDITKPHPSRAADGGSLIEWSMLSAVGNAASASMPATMESTPFTTGDILNEIVAEFNQKIDELSRLTADLPKRLHIRDTQSTGAAGDFEQQVDQAPGESEIPHWQESTVQASCWDNFDVGITSTNFQHIQQTPAVISETATQVFDDDPASNGETSQVQRVEAAFDDKDSSASSESMQLAQPVKAKTFFEMHAHPSALPQQWEHLVQMHRASDVWFAVPDFTQRTDYRILICLIILANVVYIGVEAEYEAEHFEKLGHSYLLLSVFTAIYVLDLCARMRSERYRFFVGKEAIWNLIDAGVVACAVVELCLHLYDIAMSLHGWILVRALHLMRLVRFLKLARFLRPIRGFRIFMQSIRRVTQSMACIVVVCFLWIYFFAVAIAQGSLEHCGRRNVHQEMCRKFGKPSTALSNMFKIMFQGIIWGDSFDLLGPIGVFYQVILGFFVTSNVLLGLNLALGVVVQTVFEVGQKEHDNMIDTHLRDLHTCADTLHTIFSGIDVDGSGGICLEELMYVSQHTRMNAWLESMGLSVGDLEEFFDLLDHDRTGIIDVHEFVLGCLRMKGGARNVDMMKLQLRSEWLLTNVDSLNHKLDNLIRGSMRASTCSASVEVQQSPTKTTVAAVPKHILTHEDFQEWTIINETEKRAMTMHDLKSTLHFAETQCVAHTWPDPNDANGRKLQPTMINLYSFTHHCISPLTAPHGVVLHGVGACCEGQVIVQPQNTSSSKVQAVGKVLDVSDGGVVHVQELEGRFLEEMRVMINGVDVGEPSHIDVEVSLSWKELVSGSPAKARWFCSHWWGQFMSEFVACCERHTILHGLNGLESTYWVCAYANRQHELGADITDDPENTSFSQAMQVSEGTLLLLDNEATPFQRIWCCFEIYHTVISEKPLDIVTACSEDGGQEPQLLTWGLLRGETGYMKLEREESFPLDVLLVCLRCRLQDGKASWERDKKAILRYMASDSETGSDDHAATLSLALTRANHKLHSYLAMAAWPQALKKGYMAPFDVKGQRLVLQDEIKRDNTMKQMELSFAYIDKMTDHTILCVADGLPRGLVRLQLSFEGCLNLTDRGLGSLSRALPLHLESLSLNFLGCKMVGNKGLTALAQHLPASLQELRLDFAHCELIGFEGVQVLARHVKKRLKRFAATFQGTEVNVGFRSATELHRFVRHSRQKTSIRNAGVAGRST